MEGITYAAFRTLHHELFPGACEYFTPFIAPDRRGSFKKKYLKELTAGVPSVPQLLVNSAEAFNATALKLYDLGFREINLNTGCPSGTVTAKGKGAGFLRDPEALDRFFGTTETGHASEAVCRYSMARMDASGVNDG
jgi:tRNA-dihydrouridine synthase